MVAAVGEEVRVCANVATAETAMVPSGAAVEEDVREAEWDDKTKLDIEDEAANVIEGGMVAVAVAVAISVSIGTAMLLPALLLGAAA